MNIKQASKLSGISSRNIRYYELEGLLSPMRDPGNAYRQYSENDIRTLKLIRILRMLDMPLDDIRRIVEGSEVLPQALQEQEQRLRKQSEILQAAIRYCRILKTIAQNDGSLDVDACLTRMEEDAQPNGFFAGWIYDYRRVAEAQNEESFTFIPDNPVTNARELTEALQDWGKAAGRNIVVIQESMYPHFLLDGKEYEAYRIYRRTGFRYFSVPQAVIRCDLCGRNENDAAVSSDRRRLIRVSRRLLPSLLIFFMIMFIGFRVFASQKETVQEMLPGILMTAVLAVLCGLGVWFRSPYFNDQTR